MNLPLCIYGDADSISDLNRNIQAIYDQLRTLSEGNIDGFNLHSDLVGDGLEYIEQDQIGNEIRPKKLYNSLAITTKNTYFALKGDGFTPETNYGMELIVDEDNAVGRFCIVDKDALSTQRMSLIPLVSAGISRYQVNGRTGQFGTSTANSTALIYNGTAGLTLDGTDVISAHTIRSDTTNTDDLGTSSVGWKELYIRTIDTDGANNLVLQRNNVTKMTLADTTITATATFIPDGDNQLDLGSESKSWKDLWLAGVLKIDDIQVVGSQGAAVADATDAASVITQLNTLLARVRAHGLIAEQENR